MDHPSQKIHEALQTVARLRQQRNDEPALALASKQVKSFQAQRFHATYPDLLGSSRYKAAATFFLKELYSEQDYVERDTQFARIANTIARLFPHAVVETAAALAEVHALTETLDNKMAREWMAGPARGSTDNDCALYIHCWRHLGDPAMRQRQLDLVMHLGSELDRLTGMRGLRTLLKMMRRPAAVAGLSNLQYFLETGFDAFAEMRGAQEFLGVVRERESGWIQTLFEDDAATCETKLRHLLAADGASRTDRE